ncbi:MAG: hypothetical protein AAGK02_07515 [Pseudomonadota bacterium]
MTPYIALFAGGVAGVLVAVVFILANEGKIGSPAVAAALSAAFAAYSGVTIYAEGLLPVWENHTSNMWGVQVWWDLLFAVGIGLFLIAPRARAVGMNLPLWTLAILATASIAVLAMLARLFWLEQQADEEAAASIKAKAAAETGA